MTKFADTIKVERFCRGSNAEESPDRTGQSAAEIAEGSNLLDTVTENNRVRKDSKGENARQELTTCGGDAVRVRSRNLQNQIYWQMRAARPMPGGRLRR